MADTMMVSRCGEAAISGVSLVDMINNLIIVLFAALATGGAVVVSQFLGAREQKEADASSGQLLLLSGVFGLLVGAFCFVFARPMIRLFYGAIDADVLDASVLYLKVIALSYPFHFFSFKSAFKVSMLAVMEVISAFRDAIVSCFSAI